jgi:hypothetical protein
MTTPTPPFPPIPPAVVLKLSSLVNMTPMRWTITDTEVIILFTNGKKIHFEKEPDPTPAIKQKTPAIKTTPVKKTAKTPAIKKK